MASRRPAQRALNELAQKHGLPAVRVVSGEMTGFRQRARLAIRGRLGSPKLGLFELGTHHVVHIPNCLVQHPLINRVAAVVRKALADAKVTTYSDTAHLGLARYLQVVVERSFADRASRAGRQQRRRRALRACFRL